MPEFKDLPDDFRCPYRDGCPYLEGLSTDWVWEEYQRSGFLVSDYEYQLEQLNGLLEDQRRQLKQLELKNQQLQAQLHALHRRQFKGRKALSAPPACPSTQRKKRGAPVGHPPWQRAEPTHIDQVVAVPVPPDLPGLSQPQIATAGAAS